MSDEVTMDRKVYAQLPPSKSSIQEQSNRPARQQQDGSGSSQASKNYSRPPNRRREPVFGSSYGPNPRYDSVGRKPTSQKNKVVDKRPRNRSVNSTETIVSRQEEAEIGSIHAPGGKKQNLNHLLNFHFAPRETRVFSAGSWHSHNTHPGGNRRFQQFGSVHRPKFNKEQFLQANCQFVVKSTGDYTVYKSDPDLLVEWDCVEQIFIRTMEETPRCPICLSPPVAAKMTKCGHIFCWSCMLHYLALSDKKFRTCPICYEPIQKGDLKSVVSKLCTDVQVGDEVELQLMCRPKDSFMPSPLMSKAGAEFEWEPMFSKLLPKTPIQILSDVVDREEAELIALLEDDKHCPEVCFVEQALEELDLRRQTLGAFGVVNRDEFLSVSKALGIEISSILENVEVADDASLGKSLESPKFHGPGENGSDDESLSSKGLELDNCYIFYQAMDGQNLFLHPVNMAMLWKGFGDDPSKWPQILQLRVIEKEFLTMTPEMRKRLKFLNHLPITASFYLVEVEIKPPMVSETILNEFKAQLDSRNKRRVQRIRDERRREKIREAEERRKSESFLARPKIESKQDFPDCGGNEEFEGYEEMLLASLAESGGFGDNMNQYWEDNEIEKQYDFGPVSDPIASDFSSTGPRKSESTDLSTSPSVSFAQIVSQKAAVKRSTTYPGAWGNVLLAEANSQKPTASKTSDADQDPDDYASVPDFRSSVSDAIARAFENVRVSEGDSSGKQEEKKKKKKKGKVLFSTGMGGMK